MSTARMLRCTGTLRMATLLLQGIFPTHSVSAAVYPGASSAVRSSGYYYGSPGIPTYGKSARIIIAGDGEHLAYWPGSADRCPKLPVRLFVGVGSPLNYAACSSGPG